MAKQVRSTNPRRRQPTRKPSRSRKKKRQLPRFLPSAPEFRQDNLEGSFLKSIRFTRLQRLQLLKWGLYIAICVLLLVIQDVVFSRVRIFGVTTDLAAGIILLITIMEGSEIGSVFVIFASLFYYFSGSAPGAYTVGLLVTLGILATVFRQQMWHRSPGSMVFCTGMTLLFYEMGLYGVGLFLQLTRWDRIFAFLFTTILTTAWMIPMYYVIDKVGQIGGTTWKE